MLIAACPNSEMKHDQASSPHGESKRYPAQKIRILTRATKMVGPKQVKLCNFLFIICLINTLFDKKRVELQISFLKETFHHKYYNNYKIKIKIFYIKNS